MKHTKFGKKIRDLRVDMELTQGDLAHELDLKLSYYSAVEVGRKAPSPKFVNKISTFYSLSKKEDNKLQKLASDAIDQVRISFAGRSLDSQTLALSFARRFDDLDDDTIKKLSKIINE